MQLKHIEIVSVLEVLLKDRKWTLRGTPTNQAELEEMLEYHDEGLLVDFAAIVEEKNKQESETLAKKTAAEAKLAALGLTADDLKALGL